MPTRRNGFVMVTWERTMGASQSAVPGPRWR
jgi:hypothetical protein